MPNEPYVEQIMVADGDGDNPDVEEVKYETVHDGGGGGGTNLDSLPDSTNDISDADLIVSKENNGGWVKKTALKLVQYIGVFNRTKDGLVPQAPSGSGTTKYLREDGEWIDLKSSFLDLCYPVGSIYVSTKDVSPATFLGGTWIRLNGYMLRGATSNVTQNSNTNDGGADSVTVSSVASHNHDQNSHNHTQDAHNHTQDSHNHTQDAHNHTQDSHKHGLNGAWAFNWGNGTYTYINTNMIYGNENINAPYASKQDTDSKTPTINNKTATNQAKTATNQAKTATNQSKTATNISNGASYNIATLPKYKNVFMWERTA